MREGGRGRGEGERRDRALNMSHPLKVMVC